MNVAIILSQTNVDDGLISLPDCRWARHPAINYPSPPIQQGCSPRRWRQLCGFSHTMSIYQPTLACLEVAVPGGSVCAPHPCWLRRFMACTPTSNSEITYCETGTPLFGGLRLARSPHVYRSRLPRLAFSMLGQVGRISGYSRNLWESWYGLRIAEHTYGGVHCLVAAHQCVAPTPVSLALRLIGRWTI